MFIIDVDGDVGVKNIQEFHSMLGESLKHDNTIVLDFSEVSRLDLSVVQVVAAAVRESRKTKKSLKFKGINDTVKNQFRICGLIR
ncbi:MAG: STAS domain-containing protein [Spirochaetota bacterium]